MRRKAGAPAGYLRTSVYGGLNLLKSHKQSVKTCFLRILPFTVGYSVYFEAGTLNNGLLFHI